MSLVHLSVIQFGDLCVKKLGRYKTNVFSYQELLLKKIKIKTITNVQSNVSQN